MLNMRPHFAVISILVLLATIAADCADSPLASDYGELDGSWVWTRSVGGDLYYQIITPASSKSQSVLSLSKSGAFSLYVAYQPGFGVKAGMPSDSMYTSGSYGLSKREDILLIEFKERYKSEVIALQNYSRRIQRFTSDTLEIGDVSGPPGFVSTYARTH
jgi:hypothetical protein